MVRTACCEIGEGLQRTTGSDNDTGTDTRSVKIIRMNPNDNDKEAEELDMRVCWYKQRCEESMHALQALIAIQDCGARSNSNGSSRETEEQGSEERAERERERESATEKGLAKLTQHVLRLNRGMIALFVQLFFAYIHRMLTCVLIDTYVRACYLNLDADQKQTYTQTQMYALIQARSSYAYVCICPPIYIYFHTPIYIHMRLCLHAMLDSDDGDGRRDSTKPDSETKTVRDFCMPGGARNRVFANEGESRPYTHSLAGECICV